MPRHGNVFSRVISMRDGGRIAAAIDVLGDVIGRHQPVKVAARDWGKRARYAGSKDRAWVSGLVLDALRKRNSIAHAMDDDSPRGLVLGALAHAWGWDIRKIDDAMDEQHAPSALTLQERERLVMAPDPSAASHIAGDYPEWLAPHMSRVFGEMAAIEGQAMAVRADVDLRVNTLKVDAEKAAAPLRSAKAEPSRLLKHAFHIPARDPSQREASLESIPAYSKAGSRSKMQAASSPRRLQMCERANKCWIIAQAVAAKRWRWQRRWAARVKSSPTTLTGDVSAL